MQLALLNAPKRGSFTYEHGEWWYVGGRQRWRAGVRTCQGCGQEFPYKFRAASKPPPTFCSRECKVENLYDGVRTKGGQRYLLERVDRNSPFAVMAHKRNGRSVRPYVLQHRLVMARHIGRPLERWETVHHINGDRTDNRLENLQLRVGGHGHGQIARCADCGGRHIIYEPLP